jgi:Rrf2 family protein
MSYNRDMRISEGVEWALHSCTLLALLPDGRTLPAARLAEFHGVPPAYLAKHPQALSRAGIVESVPGPRGGYRLARPTADITVLEVVEAVDGDEPAFRCTEIRRRWPAGLPDAAYVRPCGIARTMAAADAAWRAALRRRTVADLIDGLAVDVPEEAVAKGAAWFTEALR